MADVVVDEFELRLSAITEIRRLQNRIVELEGNSSQKNVG
jgi:hypothetical protein